MKKFLLIPLLLILVVLFSGCSSDIANNKSSDNGKRGVEILGASDGKATVYLFWGDGCPHCEEQKPFMDEMISKYPELEVKMYETWKNPQNVGLLKEIAERYGIKAQGVPITFIGDFEPIIGFTDSMEDDIEDKIKTCLAEGCVDPSEK